jgi:hypothetical protein
MRKRNNRRVRASSESGLELDHLDRDDDAVARGVWRAPESLTSGLPTFEVVSGNSTESDTFYTSGGPVNRDGLYEHPSETRNYYSRECALEDLREQLKHTRIQLERRVQHEKHKASIMTGEREDLLRQLAEREKSPGELQRERYKIVLQDLLRIYRKTELEKERIGFEATVELEVSSRVRRQTQRMKAKAKRQHGNRILLNSLKESLDAKVKDFDRMIAQLGRDQVTLSQKQEELAQAQRTHATEDAKLRHKATELVEIQQILTRVTRKQEETSQKEKIKYATIAKHLEAKETKWRDEVLQ